MIIGQNKNKYPSIQQREVELISLIEDSKKMKFNPLLIKGYEKQLKELQAELQIIKNKEVKIERGVEKMIYNKNITILKEKVREITKPLKSNEWFTLMVTSKKEVGDDRDFFDEKKDWLGLERTSENKIYISKDITKRKDAYRGETLIVEVKESSECCILEN